MTASHQLQGSDVRILVLTNDGERAAEAGRELVDHGLDWSLDWTDKVEAALAAEPAPDVLVCAEEVGPFRGVGLLAQLRSEHPEALRILLMGENSGQDPMAALEVAQRMLPQPLDALALMDAVETALEVQALLDDPALKRAIGRVGSLPAAPNQYLALMRLLRNPEATAGSIAALVCKDPSIATQVLRIANSAYYTTGREISDLRTAVSRIGQNALARLVLASEVFLAGTHSAEVAAMRDRSLKISRLAAALLAGPSAELAATAGLLAEVGLLLPPEACVDESGTAVPHDIAGAYLLGLWGLPAPIVEAVALHRSPARIRSFWVAGAVHLAAALVRGDDVDEEYLRRVGKLDELPRWRSLAWQSEAA
jgi:HD-like signal output (HDOD) protein